MNQTRIASIAALAALVSLVLASSAGASIVIGKSIGGLKLGMTMTQAKQKLQATPTTKTYTHPIAGPTTDLTWQGITATFAGNTRVTNVNTTLPTERTSNGLGVGSTIAAVKSGLTGEVCEGTAGTTICHVGKLVAGARVTTFWIRNSTGRVTQVGVGLVID
jgi:hypothetical protein